jgi:hypothetical protein
MKPISAIGNRCEHCELVRVKNLIGEMENRFVCRKEENIGTIELTFKNHCTIYDWAKCPYNEDK